MSISHRINCFSEDAKVLARRAWLVARHRPFIMCPICKGKGGSMQGYYEPEWSECSACWHHWEELDDAYMPWFAGRLPLWAWVQAKAWLWFGHAQPTSITRLIKCKVLGWHAWSKWDAYSEDERVRYCECCYESESMFKV